MYLKNIERSGNMGKTKTVVSAEPRISRPAIDPDARENQMIALAVDLVEQRLLNGTASSQETTHFLKLGSSKARYELEKLKAENELLKAKAESIHAMQHADEMFEKAIKAMQKYSGNGSVVEEEADDWE